MGQSGRRESAGHRGFTYAGGSGVAQAVAGQMHGGERVVGAERAREVEEALVKHVDVREDDGLQRLVVLLVQQLRELLQARVAGARVVGHVQPCEGGVHLREMVWA
jgi:outer membrane lipoprotein SlyB